MSTPADARSTASLSGRSAQSAYVQRHAGSLNRLTSMPVRSRWVSIHTGAPPRSMAPASHRPARGRRPVGVRGIARPDQAERWRGTKRTRLWSPSSTAHSAATSSGVASSACSARLTAHCNRATWGRPIDSPVKEWPYGGFLLRHDRGIEAAQALFRKALASHTDHPPLKITMGGHWHSHRASALASAEHLRVAESESAAQSI